ncbi:hypothetical protein BaRGS_00024367 [Batillaria attramentaria]|uniref:Uncharacterized protein n=1 Tax=Batillaria attramentaria TaxID=370345 RepID=A0ABD0KB98_9CAEN
MSFLNNVALFALLMTLQTTEVSGQTFQQQVNQRLLALENNVWNLARTILMQQVASEEFVRGEGDSGISLIRNFRDGTRPYHSISHSGYAAAAIHNHASAYKTCGMGELEAVLNGVHFRTRHNDYYLARPSTTSGKYDSVEEIEFPPVPPAVLNAGNVDAQIAEMREWFKAWKTGDNSTRDYRPYFKPLMCFLEGAWSEDDYFNVTEPFYSVFHSLDTWSWWDLEEKNRFVAWTGDMDFMENFAHLPRAPVDVKDDGTLVMAQWNYRILCHPIEGGLELSELKPVDDVSSRLSLDKNMAEYEQTRAVRYSINPRRFDEAIYTGFTRLDEIMAQIPGKDNYGAVIRDNVLVTEEEKLDVFDKKLLNAAYYHRSYDWYQNAKYRGFNDRNLFVAQTTQPKVTPIRAEFCDVNDQCKSFTKRVSYAIPLEVVYLTPLNTWNPFNIENKGDYQSDRGKTVTAGGRNGGMTSLRAYNGVNSMKYFLTPSRFFSGGEIESDPADTKQTVAGVLDRNGVVRNVTSSSIRIHLPEIPGVGVMRTRYPVYPVYAEGNTAYKDMDALAKIVMDLKENAYYLHKAPNFN